MSVPRLARLVARTGRIAEPSPARPEPLPGTARFGGSIHVRHVHGGGCGDCAMEVLSAFGPVYDIERYGVHLVASPRHADVLLVTGAVTRNLLVPLLRTIEAMPTPRFVIAAGDCAIDGGPLRDGYGVVGPVASVVDVDLKIPGRPPAPTQIVEALRRMTRR